MISQELRKQIHELNPSHAFGILEFLDDGNQDTDLDVDIMEFDTCIVGEIYGFDSCYAIDYHCDEEENDACLCDSCKEYANELSRLWNDNNDKDFAKCLSYLYAHVLEVHRK